MKEVLAKAESKMGKTIARLESDYAAIRAGRANPAVLDKVMVDYYGAPTPVNQLAAVSVAEARVLTIQPWDGSVCRAIERAIQTSDIGINPQSDGKTIRLIFPPLTEEKRKDIVKDVSHMAEEAKIALRSIRRDAMDKLKAMKKDGELTALPQSRRKFSPCKQTEGSEMAFGSKENKTPVQVPAHIGIIMDGNGRWAKKRGLPRTAGHTAGAQNFRTITRYASSIGVKYLTLYAFSTENWSRPAEEVSALMKLFHQYLEEALRDFMNENIRVRFIGDISAFAPDLQALIHRVEEASSVKTGMVLNLAMNYGGRAEITRAARILAEHVKNGELSPEDITEETLSGAMYTAGQPDPDLIIRPSGEERISNFLLWQSAYTEFEYFDILWPDFKPKHLDEAIEKFNSRQRRFGGV